MKYIPLFAGPNGWTYIFARDKRADPDFVFDDPETTSAFAASVADQTGLTYPGKTVELVYPIGGLAGFIKHNDTVLDILWVDCPQLDEVVRNQ